MSDFDASIIEEFVVESKEHLASIEGDLLTIEKDLKAITAESINKIFRAIHTIKGASGFLGFTTIGRLSHVMETLLSLIRSNEITATNDIIDGLIKGVDYLITMFDDVNTSNEMEIEEIYSRIESYINKDAVVTLDVKTPPTKDSEEQPATVFTIDKNLADSIPKNNNCIYILEYDLAHLAREKLSPVFVMKELSSLGVIVDTRVEKSHIDLKTSDLHSKLIVKVLFATMLEPDMAKECVFLSEDKIKAVTLDMVTSKKKTSEPAKSQPQSEPVKKPEPKIEAKKAPEKTAVAESSQPASSDSSEKNQGESIRININVLDKLMSLAGEMVLVRNQFIQSVEKKKFDEMKNISRHLDVVTSEMQEAIMLTRMQPVGNVFSKLPRIVRDLTKKLDKNIDIKMLGSEVEIDKTILQGLADPLIHLVRNCCDHAIENPEERIKAGKNDTGLITVHAYHEAGQINIKVIDDGRGLNAEKIKQKALKNGLKTESEISQMSEKEISALIMLPGFSTAEQVSEVSGRGVGMDVVKSSIEGLGGEVDLVTKQGHGTTIHMRLPLTLAIIPCLIVSVNGLRYAIPQINIEELVCLNHEEESKGLECADNQELFRLRDFLIPIVRVSEILNRKTRFNKETNIEIINKYHLRPTKEILETKRTYFAVVNVKGERFGLVVDKVIGTEEIVVKPMHSELKVHEIYSGATVMGDGSVALILNVDGISKHANISKFLTSTAENKIVSSQPQNQTKKVLLFKNGEKEQFAIDMSLIQRVEKIKTNKIEFIGANEFINIDNNSLQIVRLEKHLNVSAMNNCDDAFLLLPKNASKPVGILMSQVLDIVEVSESLNKEIFVQKGIFGTSIIKDKLTLFMDVNGLLC